MTRNGHDPTDADTTDDPTEANRPDPTDPQAAEWDTPTGDRRTYLVTDAIGGGGVMVHERGTDPTPGDDDGEPHILAGRDDVHGLEACR